MKAAMQKSPLSTGSAYMSYGRQRESIGMLEIAIGVAAGVLAANTIEWIAITSYTRFQVQWAMLEIQDQQKAERDRQNKAAQAAANIRQEIDARAQAQLEQQQQARQAARAAEIEKELAWKQFYHQPAECENMPNNDTFVRCSNEHIRARRRFEETYQP
jgi:hypothetical protein